MLSVHILPWEDPILRGAWDSPRCAWSWPGISPRALAAWRSLLNSNIITWSILFQSVADPDPGSGAFLTARTGMGKKIRIRIHDDQPRSYFRELRNHFFGLKYLNSFMQIRDLGWEKFGSGIRYKHPRSATLLFHPFWAVLRIRVTLMRIRNPDPGGHFDADADPDSTFHLRIRVRILLITLTRIRILPFTCGFGS